MLLASFIQLGRGLWIIDEIQYDPPLIIDEFQEECRLMVRICSAHIGICLSNSSKIQLSYEIFIYDFMNVGYIIMDKFLSKEKQHHKMMRKR
jgi:hypothetical protein